MTFLEARDFEPLDLPELDLHGMGARLVTWHNGKKFARFFLKGRHHDLPATGIDQRAVDAVRNTLERKT